MGVGPARDHGMVPLPPSQLDVEAFGSDKDRLTKALDAINRDAHRVYDEDEDLRFVVRFFFIVLFFFFFSAAVYSTYTHTHTHLCTKLHPCTKLA